MTNRTTWLACSMVCCLALSAGARVARADGCSSNGDCKGGRVCEAGQCRDAPPAAGAGICDKDSDCPGDQICRQGVCVPPAGAATNAANPGVPPGYAPAPGVLPPYTLEGYLPAPPAAAAAAPKGLSDFGHRGVWVFGLDRLAGVTLYDATVQDRMSGMGGGGKTEFTGTDINLLYFASGTYGGGNAPLVINRQATTPRLQADYFLAPQISVGASVGYDNRSSNVNTSTGSGNTNTDILDEGLIAVEARAGYFLGFNDRLGLWGRAGIGFVDQSGSESQGGTTTSDLSYVSVSAEANLVLALTHGLALTVGPFVDLGLVGSASSTSGGMTQSFDYSELDYGLTTGVIGWL